MVVGHTLGKTLVCLCFCIWRIFVRKFVGALYIHADTPWPPLATPKYTAKSWVPYPLVLPWLYFGVAWLVLVCICDHICIAYGKCTYLSLPNAILLITLHTLVSSLATPWYNFLGSVFLHIIIYNWTYPFGLTGPILFFSCGFVFLVLICIHRQRQETIAQGKT